MDGSSSFRTARLSRSGRAPQRLLVIGDAVSVAVEGGQSAGLPDALVARVDSGGGLDVDVMWGLAAALRAVADGSDAWRLWRYDAVVVVVSPVAQQGGRLLLRRLLLRVVADLAVASQLIVVVAMPTDRRSEGRAARRRAQRFIAQLTEVGMPFHVLTAPTIDTGALAVDEVAPTVLRLLAAPAGTRAGTAGERRGQLQDEQARQQAVDRVESDRGALTPHLARVVQLARNSFDVPYVQVNLVSHGRLRTLAYTGRAGDDEVDPLCAIAIRSDGPTLIADTALDQRYAGNPNVEGERPVRFYAAHPLETLDGYRVGVLCVFDFEPHPINPDDDVLLRDLALLAEGELNTLKSDEL